MSKKKRSGPRTANSCSNNPFKRLKGFAVSAPEDEMTKEPKSDPEDSTEKSRSFAEEMDFLGVAPLTDGEAHGREIPSERPERPTDVPREQTDEELFLGSLGRLDVRFSDRVPQKIKPATPRRLKQLKQGRLTPDASLDLHGLQRHQVTAKIEHFLQNAVHQQWQTLLIVTGRGLHSAAGEPVLRDAAEKFVATEGKSLIAE